MKVLFNLQVQQLYDLVRRKQVSPLTLQAITMWLANTPSLTYGQWSQTGLE